MSPTPAQARRGETHLKNSRAAPAHPAPQHVDWLQQLRSQGVARVAVALGYTYIDHPVPGSLAPCPACGAAKRSSSGSDKRGPVGLHRSGLGWACHRCKATGDSVGLAMWRVGGGELKKGDPAWRDVWNLCAEANLCDPAPGAPATPRKALPPLPPPPSQAAAKAPTRPPELDLKGFWAACSPVTRDAQVGAWLEGRGLDPSEVEQRDLARALPVSLRAPPWASFQGRPWNQSPQMFRVIVPLFSRIGALESVHARALTPQDPKGRDKAASPGRAELSGLVMADPLGRLLLQGGKTGSGAPAAELVREVGLIVAEGEPDYLTWSTTQGENGPAVWGIVAGSWPEAGAGLPERIPDGCTVTIATHRDPAGDAYAARIYASLKPRVQAKTLTLRRWKGRE